MKIYTLYYKNTKLYNHSVFVCPNDETAIEAMKLNLMDSKAERFRNQVKNGNVELRAITYFDEEDGCTALDSCAPQIICNLKDLLNDNNGNLENPKQDNS